jgi:uncharacterized repeat protein (TIGR02543 family)
LPNAPHKEIARPKNDYQFADESLTVKSGDGFSNTGYRFDGWNTQANGKGTHYAAGSSLTPSADTTLYAEWSIAVTSVTLNTRSTSVQRGQQQRNRRHRG